MKTLVIDSQGGGLGKLLITGIRERFPDMDITAVGTNALATSAMIKAGAHHSATGENALKTACRTHDLIIGPIGIVIADSMYGEISPKMAKAVGQSGARRILIPFSHCDTVIAGVPKMSLSQLASAALDEMEIQIRQIKEEKELKTD